jgi:hypothetical protein
MKGLLVRVGVDNTYGHWNAPVDEATGRFMYVPIPERVGLPFHPNLERRYDEVLPALNQFCKTYTCDLHADLRFPRDLIRHPMHLDPDFAELTYGDDGGRRGAEMVGMDEGDLLVFYAGLRPIAPSQHNLIYAIVGLYVVDEVVRAEDVAPGRWGQNAHTRKSKRGETDIVVRAKPVVSGRLERCIPIGEWRDRSYRVRDELLDAWGTLSVKNGFIQRSIVPPSFNNPERFYEWFLRQSRRLLMRNNW